MGSATKTLVGFGFGPIQSGLFLYEAYVSGNFRRFVVSEIDESLVTAVGENNGRYSINIARRDRIDQFTLEGIDLYNPRDPAGREAIVRAVAESDEMVTALPNVNVYDAGGRSGVVSILSEGLGGAAELTPTILYAAENNNHAAEILLEKLTAGARAPDPANFQVLNTVIGKMSGVITEPEIIERLDLVTITPDIRRAILIEEFNCILISRVTLSGYRRGIDVFREKDQLLPFEEAKLYGHNAVHALIGFLADLRGLNTIAEAGHDRRIMDVARKAFVDESGPAMIRRNAGAGDAVFTPAGYRHYAEDLLERMTCPNLNDLVARVVRDHVRKLGYDDRLYGTMRMAIEAGVEPVNLALGAAAGVLSMIERRDDLAGPVAHLPASHGALSAEILRDLLLGLWGRQVDSYADKLVSLTSEALQKLRRQPWQGQWQKPNQS
jgi:mannitol-1-phosphate 5-dehydrogenase